MSFNLPEGWNVTKDIYNISNGQGFVNRENYLSIKGKVISLFEIHRDPDEFFENYQSLVESYTATTDAFVYEKDFSLKFGEFSFPVYIIKGVRDPIIYTAQVFVNCGDCLGCFMITLDTFSDNNKELIAKNPAFAALVEILRTVE